MDKIKVIIDTDIGDDIDDTLAISLALSMPDLIEVIGITTVFNDTRLRAKNVYNLLSAYGKTDIPVIAGYGKTEGGFQTPDPFLKEEIPYAFECDFTPNYCEEAAVDFIIDACRKYGKNLVVIPLGPFTNISKVIKKAPDALNGILKVVIMGGAFYKQYADWNVFCDPDSAKVVFDNLTNLFALGADVTHKLPVDDKYLDALFNYNGANEGVKLVAKTVKAWQTGGKKQWGGTPKVTLHDPLAVYSAVDESFVKAEKVLIDVVTKGAFKGFTVNLNAYSKSHLNDEFNKNDFNLVKVAKDVDSDAFIKRFFDILLNN